MWKLESLGRDLGDLVNSVHNHIERAVPRLAMAAKGQPETTAGALWSELGIARPALRRHMSPTGLLRLNEPRLLAKA